jgi:hypothetical protein
MKALVLSMTFVASLLTAVDSYAQAPTTAPAGTTALCNDGTYYSGASKKGACRGHQGVKDWYGAAAATTPAAPPAAPQPKAVPTPATPPKSAATSTAPAAGGGPGQVWVNTSSKVYHCPTDKWYGKTKHGEYMSEADAKAQGFHADHGKPCQ